MNRAKLVVAVIAALGASLVISGCGGTDKALTDLQSDPTASLTLSGTKLVHESTYESGTAMGKPVHAEVIREFRTLAGVPIEKPLAAAKRMAVQSGWRLKSNMPPEGFIALKTIRKTRAELTVTVSGTHRDTLVVDIVAD